MSLALERLTWPAREPPLRPVVALAEGEAALRLGRRLLEGPTPEGLLAGAAPGRLLIWHPAGELPWEDGLTWLGQEPGLPELYVPTTLRPPVAPALALDAVRAATKLEGPIALLPGPLRALSLRSCRSLWIPALERWLAGAA